MEAAIEKVENLARNGVFGPGEVVRVVPTADDGKAPQYMSQLSFLRVDMKTDSGVKLILVVVKAQLDNNDERELLGTVIQFANEVTMYKKILPKLQTSDLGITCTMLYGHATAGDDPTKDIIIFDDLRPSGYKVSKSVFVDHHHVALVVRKLGQYHGSSYKFKKQSRGSLEDLAKELLSPPFVDGGPLFGGSLQRGFKPLIDKQPNGMADKAYQKILSVSREKLWKALRKPEEPFAVIAHGDFNVNNLLFAYDEHETVSDVKFIDFATSMYSHPAVDLSFFLYMNTSQETRDEYWDEFLRIYWEGVTSVEKDPGFVFDEFLEQFGKRAIWGYLPCSFFLPMMLFPETANPTEFLKLTEEEKWTRGMENGGEKATQATSCIVRHLLDKGYLEKFVDNFDLTST